MRRTLNLSILVTALAGTAVAPANAAADASYRLLAPIKVEGQGTVQALRVDAVARRLFVARQGAIEVLDLDGGKRVGAIELKGDVTAIAIAPEIGRGFAAQAGDKSVTAFDLATLKVINTEKLSGEPSSLIFDPGTKQVFVSGKDGTLTALVGSTGKQVGSLALGGVLRQAVVDTRGGLFVADSANNSLHVVDTKTLKSLGQIPSWPAEKPTGLVLDNKERRIYVAAENNRMVIVDPDAGQMIGQVETKGRGAAGLAIQYQPSRFAWLLMPTADGNVSIIKNAKLTASLDATVAANVKSDAVDFDPKSGRAFLGGDAEILVLGK